MICPKRTHSVSLVSREKKSAYEKKLTKVKELTKMLKIMVLVPICFFLLAVDYALEGSKF